MAEENKESSSATPAISMETPPDILYATFQELQQREEKLKEHLRTALRAQKVASESYEKEKEARQKMERIAIDMGEKCTEVQKSSTADRERMLGLFKEQSERIDVKVKLLTEQNEKLIKENASYRERITKLIDDTENRDQSLQATSLKWINISNDMKQQVLATSSENEKLKTEMNELILGAIQDKKSITTHIKEEQELRATLKQKTAEFYKMYEKALEQAKFTTSLATDMKKMRKDLNGVKKQLIESETVRANMEANLLQIGKEKLEGDVLIKAQHLKIEKLESLCRAMQERGKKEGAAEGEAK